MPDLDARAEARDAKDLDFESGMVEAGDL